MIIVKNLTKIFHTGQTRLTALNKINFEVPTGQFLAITGRSGAGKSTALYQLSLLDTPTEGNIIINGQDVSLVEDQDRIVYRRDNFGFIFQDYALLPTLTATENVILPMLMQGLSKKSAVEKGHIALEKVDLADKFDNLPSQLSRGEQQRVSIARSIVHEPKILFADEPTANLDTESANIILKIFRQLNKETNLTLIMVTHEPDYAKLTDRQIELLDGKIIRDRKNKK